jgi:hypothetical protein
MWANMAVPARPYITQCLPTECWITNATITHNSNIFLFFHILEWPNLLLSKYFHCQSRGLRPGSTAASLLGLRVRMPRTAWMSVSFECCVLSGWGLCAGPIPRPEASYWLWCVLVCDIETASMRWLWSALGCSIRNKYFHSLHAT